MAPDDLDHPGAGIGKVVFHRPSRIWAGGQQNARG
jgi:hypothetical protein